MYPQYFGLKEASFSITPDPHYLFLSEQHREALAHLLYGASENGGFVLLSGEVGTGKTTVCRAFLEQLPAGVEVALVLNPALTAIELMHAICDEFGLSVPANVTSAKALLDRLNRFLLDAHADGRHPVLIIDEAQNLRPKVLEQVRLLTNLETTKAKLLQIFLIGQPELKTMLASPELRQLNQRITARFHLRPLDARATAAYIEHRIAVAGVDRPLFTPAALRAVHRHAGGVPRLINLICDRALLGAALSRRIQVTPEIVRRAAREVHGEQAGQPARLPKALALAASLLLAAGLGAWLGASGQLGRLGERLATRLAAPTETPADDAARADTPIRLPAADAPRPDQPVAAVATATPGTAPAPAPAITPTPALAETTAATVPGAPPADTASAATVADADAPVVDPPRPTASGAPRANALAIAEPTAPVAPVATDEPAPPPVASAPSDQGPHDATPNNDAGSPAADAPRIALARITPALTEIDAAALPGVTLTVAEAVPALLGRWGVQPTVGIGCNGLPALGLACERAAGRWNDLRRFDRPAALRLQLDGRQRYALVIGLDEEFAIVEHAGKTVQVPVATLDEHWSGEFLMLWRPPVNGVRNIGGSASGPAVQWLRTRLAALPESGLSATGPDHFDAALGAAVRRFQRAQDLSADGIAGPRTLILLDNVLAGADVPRLSQTR